MDLIPPGLVAARFFAAEQAAIEAAQAKHDEATRMLEEFIEEHTGEGGMLEDAVNEKGKVTKAAVKERSKEIEDNPELADELQALEICAKHFELESLAAKFVKELQEELDKRVLAQYAKLHESEIKTLAVDDKWFASIKMGIEGEVNGITQWLSSRVQELSERYSLALPQLTNQVSALAARVEQHLRVMEAL
jgi:type I restriction enzyme M protein